MGSKYFTFFAALIANLEVVDNIKDLDVFLKQLNSNKTIGFVPTMGALHHAHLSLIKQSLKCTDITICSIFVNPKQFNNQGDLTNYPRNLEKDINLLTSTECDVLFCPSVDEMYPTSTYKVFDFGELTSIMEGKHRPGHFNGVALVIQRFLEIIHPTYAFFGEKDYQQFAVIKALVNQINSPVQIIDCPTIREQSGLAMSSRNERLTHEEKEAASLIYQSLMFINDNKNKYSIDEIKIRYTNLINANHHLKTEYIEIADGNSLQPITSWGESNYIRAFTAVHVRDVRLIDNIILIN